ncbi:RraA family protein [Microvirga zambiensis]|uniref:RraA family protein n=1 Tax=Microvirga zambiensis TaxID=1402137 RepID=UPI00191D2DDF|nr:RraA family protein [Microvirga zambiensis]
MAVGFRYRKTVTRVSQQLVDAFRELPVANVSDCMARLTAAGPTLRPMHRQGSLAGPALTVRCKPGDNLMIHKAIDMAEPGDVIVVDGGGDLTNALFGELMLAHATKRGLGGFVIDGAVRDIKAIQSQDLPVFAAGITHRGPYKDGPGEIGFGIVIGGMSVGPGDLILGDWDGLVTIPASDAPAVLAAAQAKFQSEIAAMAAIEAGQPDRSWIDTTLARLGCEEINS